MSETTARNWQLYDYEVGTVRTLATARGPIRSRRGVLLRLTDGSGRSGWGESSPLPGFGSTAAGALETALVDLLARRAGLPMALWLDRRAGRAVRVHRTIGADDPVPAGRLPAAKIKIGCLAWPAERRRLIEFRERHPECLLRLDAGGAWSRDEALDRLASLADLDLGIDYVEQPVAGLDDLVDLAPRSPLAIAADEVLSDPAAAERLIAGGAVGVLVLKPAVLGGPVRTLALWRRARAAGLRCVGSSLLDAAVGRTMALHVVLAAEAGSADEVHGLATGDLLAGDVARAPSAADGWLERPDGPGLGVDPGPFVAGRP